MGTGNVQTFAPPMYLYNGCLTVSAAALATANDTPNIALAPRLDLFSVPSTSIMI